MSASHSRQTIAGASTKPTQLSISQHIFFAPTTTDGALLALSFIAAVMMVSAVTIGGQVVTAAFIAATTLRAPLPCSFMGDASSSSEPVALSSSRDWNLGDLLGEGLAPAVNEEAVEP